MADRISKCVFNCTRYLTLPYQITNHIQYSSCVLTNMTECFGTMWCLLFSWWRHQMETFSTLLAICAGNSPVPGEFPTQRPVTRSFDVFFDLRLNKRLSKQSWGWWFETLSRPLWRHRNVDMKLRLMWYILLPVWCGACHDEPPQLLRSHYCHKISIWCWIMHIFH